LWDEFLLPTVSHCPPSFHSSPTGSHLAYYTVIKYVVMKYVVVVINFQFVPKPSNVNTVRQLTFNGKGLPDCENKGGAPTSEGILILLLPNKVHKGMLSKRRAITRNKHVNNNLKRWKAAAGTPTTIIKITHE